MRKQEIDFLRGPLILNLNDSTLDFGNWNIKRNLPAYSLIWSWFLGCRCMQPASWNASNAKVFESWKLCNAHDILSYFCDFDFVFLLFFLFVENTNWLSLSERRDNSWDLTLCFANLFGDSLRVYILFDLVTWQFWVIAVEPFDI